MMFNTTIPNNDSAFNTITKFEGSSPTMIIKHNEKRQNENSDSCSITYQVNRSLRSSA